MDIVLDGKFIHTVPLETFRTLPMPVGWHLAGFSFYLASPGNPKMPGRVWIDDALGMGYSLVANFELSGNEWTLGYGVGVKHGELARQQARLRGVPDDSPIIQSGMDTNVPASGYQTAFEYQQGFNIGAGGTQGAYGPGYMIALMSGQRLINVGWQWKDGHTPTVAAANMRQTYLQPWGASIGGVGYDVNIAAKPYWGQFGESLPIPPIPPGEDDMASFSLVQHNGGAVWRIPSDESSRTEVTSLQAIACDFDILRLHGDPDPHIVQLVDGPNHDWAAWLSSIPVKAV